MPIYAYKCTNCGFEKDYLQKMSDKPITKCPKCGQDTMKKELSAPGFELKGTGWAAQILTAARRPSLPLMFTATNSSSVCRPIECHKDRAVLIGLRGFSFLAIH